ASNNEFFFSRFLMDPESGISYDEPQPNTFSFNSPYGACDHCDGLGYVFQLDRESVIPDNKLSIMRGGILPIGEYKDNWTFQQLKALGKKYGFSLTTPIKELSDEHLDLIFHGSPRSEERRVGNDDCTR